MIAGGPMDSSGSVSTYRVEEFGARADGRTENTTVLQAAVDYCSGHGGGVVRLSSGTYLSGTLELKSGVELHVQQEAILKAIPDLARYPEIPRMLLRDGCSENPNEEKKGYALLYAFRAQDVSLSGTGTIDVGGEWFQDKLVRPFALRIIECTSVCVDGLTFRQSAAWSCHFQLSRDIDIRDLTIRTSGIRNGDGLDIDSSSDVAISGCNIQTTDDAICLKTTTVTPCSGVRVTDCVLESGCSGVKVGSESVGDFTNIRVSRCTLRKCGVVAVKVTAVDGGSVDDVEFADLTIEDSTGPILVATGNRGRRYTDQADPERRSRMRNLSFRRMNITTARYERGDSGLIMYDRGQGIVVSGRPGQLITNVTFEDLDVAFWGGIEYSAGETAEIPVLTDEYPECHKLGVLPSYGYFSQYAKNVTVRRCTDRLINPDVRPLRLDGPGTG